MPSLTPSSRSSMPLSPTPPAAAKPSPRLQARAAPSAASASSTTSRSRMRPVFAEGLAALTQTRPRTRRRAPSHFRVAESLSRLGPHFPGDPATGILAADSEDSLLFEDFGNDEPCPVLDPVAGTCDLYGHRPIVCRTFGPPMRTTEGNLATCELCYITASTEEIIASELDPTMPEIEARSNTAYNALHKLRGETVVAFALRYS